MGMEIVGLLRARSLQPQGRMNIMIGEMLMDLAVWEWPSINGLYNTPPGVPRTPKHGK